MAETIFISGFLSSADQNSEMSDVDYKAIERMIQRSSNLRGAVLSLVRNESSLGNASLDDIGDTWSDAIRGHEAFEEDLKDQPLPSELKRRSKTAANDVLPETPAPLSRRRAGPRNRR